MDYRIADTFTASLAKLTGEEQKFAKITAFDLQLNPANPGMSLHRLERPRIVTANQMRTLMVSGGSARK